jgi:hypothetical protein
LSRNCYPQDRCDRALTGHQDDADDQNLDVLPDLLAERWRKGL